MLLIQLLLHKKSLPFLRPKDIFPIVLQTVYQDKKIGLFKNAKNVIGPIGGGLANVLFCPPETNVISINSPEFFPINERLKYALNHTNLHLFNHTKLFS